MPEIDQVLAELDQQEAEAIDAYKRAIFAYFENLAAIRGARQALTYLIQENQGNQIEEEKE